MLELLLLHSNVISFLKLVITIYNRSTPFLCHIIQHQQIYSNFGLDSKYTTFLERATSEFNERAKCYRSDGRNSYSDGCTYKGGIMYWSSQTAIDPAKTAFAFMVSSLYKKWSTIVRLFPCSNSSATELFLSLRMLLKIERCGLYVKALCTDNYYIQIIQ